MKKSCGYAVLASENTDPGAQDDQFCESRTDKQAGRLVSKDLTAFLS